MNTEPLRYVAAIVIGGKDNKITPTSAVVPENTDSRWLSVRVLPTKTFVCCTCWTTMVRVKLQTAGLQRGGRRGRSDCKYSILTEDKASSGHHSSAFADVSADAYREDAVL